MEEGTVNAITFKPRWREELEAITFEGKVILELTMGTYHVYFPDESCWLTQAPEWAKQKWQEYLTACEAWCKQNKVPITVVDNAHVYEEK